MSDVIDLTQRKNRQMLGLDIWIGTVFFSGCYPTEPMSSYFWRIQDEKWIARVDRWLGRGHCYESYCHSKAHLFDAPEYRP